MPSKPETIRWQEALERELAEARSSKLTVPYDQVARAFPSQSPHPDTFEFNLIDDMTFTQWAEARGWKAIPIQESSAGETSLGDILFIRIT